MSEMSEATSAPAPVVRVAHLVKTFRHPWKWWSQHVAVNDISFEVRAGEIFGLIGPNGAGKTTTIKTLTGLIKPTEGQITIFGREVGHADSRRRIGYLPEGPYFYEHLTAHELLLFYGRLHGIDADVLRRRADELITTVGLDHARGRPIRKFSKGMRQRAGLAQALINDPEFVILDEPQTGLDPVGRKDVRELIFSLKRQGKTVLVCSHILPDVEAVADRVAVLHQGQLREVGTLHELTSQRVRFIEVLARGVDPEAPPAGLAPELVEQRGDLVLLHLPGDMPTARIFEILHGAGAEIVSLVPQRETLEDVFMRDTRAPQAEPPAAPTPDPQDAAEEQ